MPHPQRRRAVAVAATLGVVLLGGCEAATPDGPDRSAGSGNSQGTGATVPTAEGPSAPAAAGDLGLARSEPREDSVYPETGDPGVDALHYDLDLTWQPEREHLDAVERLTFRAAQDARSVQLDLSDRLEVTDVTVDGTTVDWHQRPRHLRIRHAVEADERYVVELAYQGTPAPVPAPTERSDFDGLGWHVTDTGETWTMQEPYGALTWYAVNDQPADKALYDFSLTVPTPWTGVANGTLVDSAEADGRRTTTWHLPQPASSYLITVAFGDYTAHESTSGSGVPVTVWSPSDRPGPLGETGHLADALDWAEELLGPYPFDTLGAVIVDSPSAMETQTMLTLGDTAYATSRAVLVHEVVHQWYGNSVSPADWSEMWMNEGITMYLQWWWEAEHGHRTLDGIVADIRPQLPGMRRAAGPPGDYDADNFGQGNVYYVPAVMWHRVRQRVGDEAFSELLRAWPNEHANTAQDREDYLAWLEEATGEELSGLFDRWLLGDAT